MSCIAFNQQASTMYHDMGYPSHGYSNYLAQYESSSYGDATHFMHHLSSVPVGSQLPVPSLVPPPPPPLPPPPYADDPLHQRQHLPIMHPPPESRTWYQPPLAVTPHSDHRYKFPTHNERLPRSYQITAISSLCSLPHLASNKCKCFIHETVCFQFITSHSRYLIFFPFSN